MNSSDYMVHEENANQNHPELREGENFLTNTTREKLLKLREKYPDYILRVGKTAYMEDGRILADHMPVFWKPKPIPAGKDK